MPRGVRLLRRFRDDRGSVTAEFAIVLPAVLMVLGLALGSILLATNRLVLSSAASEVARLEARGDTGAAAERIAALGGGASVQREGRGALHCVALTASPGRGALSLIEVSGRGCAAVSDSGQ